MIRVEVAYALPDEQKIITLNVNPGTTVYEAILWSKIHEFFPQINVENDPVGIFGKTVKDPHSTVLRDNERVEIYRPLLADPKEVRARKAKEKAMRASAVVSSSSEDPSASE